MRIYFAVLFLAFLAAVPSALEAAMCSHEMCLKMPCLNIKVEMCEQIHGPSEDHTYRVLPHGAFCGCCPSCQKILSEFWFNFAF